MPISINWKLVGFTILCLVMMTDFYNNVWINFLQSRDLNKEIPSLNPIETTFFDYTPISMGELFGLQVANEEEVDEATVAAQKAEQALKEQEALLIAERKLLQLGKSDIRLQGVAATANHALAMLQINHQEVEGRSITLKINETLELADGVISVKLLKVDTTSVTLFINNKDQGTMFPFNLVMFEYDGNQR